MVKKRKRKFTVWLGLQTKIPPYNTQYNATRPLGRFSELIFSTTRRVQPLPPCLWNGLDERYVYGKTSTTSLKKNAIFVVCALPGFGENGF